MSLSHHGTGPGNLAAEHSAKAHEKRISIPEIRQAFFATCRAEACGSKYPETDLNMTGSFGQEWTFEGFQNIRGDSDLLRT